MTNSVLAAGAPDDIRVRSSCSLLPLWIIDCINATACLRSLSRYYNLVLLKVLPGTGVGHPYILIVLATSIRLVLKVDTRLTIIRARTGCLYKV